MRKPKTKQKLWLELEEEVKRIVRADPCVVDTQGKCRGRIQGSHVLPKGAYPALRCDPLNILPMCWHHHMNWWHRNPVDGFRWLSTTFPALERALRERAKVKPQFDRAEILELLDVAKKTPELYREFYELKLEAPRESAASNLRK